MAEPEAGRALDTLIEERIFGNPVDYEFDEPIVKARRDQYDEWGFLPHYSTEIADAWLVVEHLRTQRLHLILNDTLSAWRAVFEPNPPPGYYYIAANGPRPQDMVRYGFGELPALAICRAALLAVGVD